MKSLVAMLSIVVMLASGCAMPLSAPAYGGFVTSRVKGPVSGVDNDVKPEKMGTAEARAIIFFAEGDASISAAMEAGGITKVHHVDCEVFSIMGVYATYKTVVYGE